jgi:PAS domain S-box-containing protein
MKIRFALPLILAAALLIAAAFEALWIPRTESMIADDLRILGLGAAQGAALVADIRDDQQMMMLVFAVVATLLLLGGWTLLERRTQQSAVRIADKALRFARGEFAEAPAEADRLAAIDRAVGELGRALESARQSARRESEQRTRTEAALRTSEERYALAVRCANDGLWEWDRLNDSVYYASNWKALLGYGDDEIGHGLGEWTERIHPDEREAVRAALDAHVAGESSIFEYDHRLRHKDGSYRWFLARGQAVRSGDGSAGKVIGLITDITSRKRAEAILLGIARGLSEARGDAFFQVLVKNFAEVLGTKMAFICQCANYPTTRVRMLAWWNDGAFAENMEFDLEGTPCNEVITKGELTFVPCGVEKLFPREVGLESYLGLPILSHDGRVIGHLACFDTKEMHNDLPRLPIFTIFAVRAGIEIEQRMLDRQAALGPHPN